MRSLIKFLFPFLAAWLVADATTAQKPASSTDQKVREFEAYVLKAQKEWNVPGLAVAVVKDGKVLLEKGYGVRELGTSDPVNPQTLFACASTTKAMTAACMGMLVDEGKVRWEDPVIRHLPEFQLYDPYVTREIKIRDLFIHDTGLGNADFLWGIMAIPSDQILEKMRDVRPSYSLRSGFMYQNIFYLAAGEVIERVSGKPWSEFIRERIFQPLGMTRTVPLQRLISDPNQTKPHYRMEGKVTVISHTNADEIGPAGSVWSCIGDISRWMLSMLDSSKYSGGRLLSPGTWAELFRPQVVVPLSQFFSTAKLTKPNWMTYGLGWFQHDYKGRKVNLHTGSLAGAVAIHAQLPEERMAICVFGNLDHAEIRHGLVYKAFDHFALGGTRDWSKEILSLYAELQVKAEKTESEFEGRRVMNTRPSLPLASYAGRYSDPLYGEATVSVEGDRLKIVQNNFSKATVEHWHYDTFRGWYDKRWYGKGNAVFRLGAGGNVAAMNFDGIEFKKLPE